MPDPSDLPGDTDDVEGRLASLPDFEMPEPSTDDDYDLPGDERDRPEQVGAPPVPPVPADDWRVDVAANAIGFYMLSDDGDSRPISTYRGVPAIDVTDDEAEQCKLAARHVLAHLDAIQGKVAEYGQVLPEVPANAYTPDSTELPIEPDNLDATGTDAPPAYDGPTEAGRTIALNELTSRLCWAVGLDPNTVTGFRLTVQGGAYPLLERWDIPPMTGDGDLLDTWVGPLGGAVADTTYAMLPGKGDVPPAEPYTDLPGMVSDLPSDATPDVWLARHLRQLLDAVNGAPLPPEERDHLTVAGHQVWNAVTERVHRAVLDNLGTVTEPPDPNPT